MQSNERFEKALHNLQNFIAQFSEAGGRLVAGSDSTSYKMYGISLHRELELLVDSGVTPMNAILGTTKYAAEKYNKWDEVGSIEPGKYGDFVILDANPLTDIRNTRTIDTVIQNGRVVDTTLDGKFDDKVPNTNESNDKFIELMEELLF